MRDEAFYVETKEKILDFDVNEKGELLVAMTESEVFTPHLRFVVENHRFPLIRKIDENRFLVVDHRRADEENAFIYDIYGKVIQQFYAGYDINDVIIQNQKIVVSYGDEGMYSLPSMDGLCVFNINGDIEFGFNSHHGEGYIGDCYCMCPVQRMKILFFAYTEFHIVELHLENFSYKFFDTPELVHGSSAISLFCDGVIFHSPYKDERGFYLWEIGSKNTKRIGEYAPTFRGLRDGKFLSLGEAGYTIIEPMG